MQRPADARFAGSLAVPVLWDTKTNQIVNNESSEIIRMFNHVRPLGSCQPDEGASHADELRG